MPIGSLRDMMQRCDRPVSTVEGREQGMQDKAGQCVMLHKEGRCPGSLHSRTLGCDRRVSSVEGREQGMQDTGGQCVMQHRGLCMRQDRERPGTLLPDDS